MVGLDTNILQLFIICKTLHYNFLKICINPYMCAQKIGWLSQSHPINRSLLSNLSLLRNNHKLACDEVLRPERVMISTSGLKFIGAQVKFVIALFPVDFFDMN